MIALITPTGARPQQIKLCKEFMRKQDYEGEVLWVIVDDAIPVTTDHIHLTFRQGWTIEKCFPTPAWKPGMNTQARNLLAGIAEVKKRKSVEAIFIIEDDDYYRPEYLRLMVDALSGHCVAGQIRTIYYNPIIYAYSVNPNIHHASLFQLAFTSNLLPTFEHVCDQRMKFIDIGFFKMIKDKRIHLFDGTPLAVGMKGLPGRAGIGIGHKIGRRMIKDENKRMLKEWLKEDYIYYV